MHQKKMIGKNLRKLMLCLPKIYIYISCLCSHEKQVILLMISNGEKQWYYLAVKKHSALLRGKTWWFSKKKTPW